MNQEIIIFVIGALVVVFLWYLWTKVAPPEAIVAWNAYLFGGLVIWGSICLLLFPNILGSKRNDSISEQYVLEPMENGDYYETYQDKTIIRVKTEDGNLKDMIIPRDKVIYSFSESTLPRAEVSFANNDKNSENISYEKVILNLINSEEKE